MSVTPRRSVLYMPGSNARAIEKARSLAADVIVLDLEDSVGPQMKVSAREQVCEELAKGGFGYREMVVRINSLDTQWADQDIASVAASNASAICLPKVESAAELEQLVNLLEQHNAPTSMQVWGMIETPRGVLNIEAITKATDRLTVLAMGTTDLAKELRVPHTPDRIGLLTSLSNCVIAARAEQIDILDGVYLDLDNQDGFHQACIQGLQLGFDGKTLIHPKQLSSANKVFSPDANDLDRAQKILEAWQVAEAEGKGVVVVDGRLVEGMHVDEAKRLLEIHNLVKDR